jgi:hypothetical protein
MNPENNKPNPLKSRSNESLLSTLSYVERHNCKWGKYYDEVCLELISRGFENQVSEFKQRYNIIDDNYDFGLDKSISLIKNIYSIPFVMGATNESEEKVISRCTTEYLRFILDNSHKIKESVMIDFVEKCKNELRNRQEISEEEFNKIPYKIALIREAWKNGFLKKHQEKFQHYIDGFLNDQGVQEQKIVTKIRRKSVS